LSFNRSQIVAREVRATDFAVDSMTSREATRVEVNCSLITFLATHKIRLPGAGECRNNFRDHGIILAILLSKNDCCGLE